MRTTIDIDPTVLDVARDLANHSRRSIGAVISELAKRGIEAGKASGSQSSRNGFPVFALPTDTPPVTSELVKQLLADEDLPA